MLGDAFEAAYRLFGSYGDDSVKKAFSSSGRLPITSSVETWTKRRTLRAGGVEQDLSAQDVRAGRRRRLAMLRSRGIRREFTMASTPSSSASSTATRSVMSP